MSERGQQGEPRAPNDTRLTAWIRSSVCQDGPLRCAAVAVHSGVNLIVFEISEIPLSISTGEHINA